MQLEKYMVDFETLVESIRGDVKTNCELVVTNKEIREDDSALFQFYNTYFFGVADLYKGRWSALAENNIVKVKFLPDVSEYDSIWIKIFDINNISNMTYHFFPSENTFGNDNFEILGAHDMEKTFLDVLLYTTANLEKTVKTIEREIARYEYAWRKTKPFPSTEE